jgi:hypothetical protein
MTQEEYLAEVIKERDSALIENSRLRGALRENVGEAYNLITQGESPMARRQPSAQRIYDRSKEALAQTKDNG